jgi:hypothetical protein
VQQITVIVSSLGAIYKETLKRLASVMEPSPAKTVPIGQHLPEVAINGSHTIWKQYQQEMTKTSPAISISRTTSEVGSAPIDFSDFEQPPIDTEEDNSHNQTVVIDCTPGELNFGTPIVAEVEQEDDVASPSPDPDEFARLIEEEDDKPMLEDESDDELIEEEVHPSRLFATPSEIESPGEGSDSPPPPELQPRRTPRSLLREAQQRQILGQEENQVQTIAKWKPDTRRRPSKPPAPRYHGTEHQLQDPEPQLTAEIQCLLRDNAYHRDYLLGSQ